MFGRGSNDTELWRETLQPLVTEAGYADRLDKLLAFVGAQTDVPGCYLYLLDDNGQQFHLEHTWLKPADTDPGLWSGSDADQGAEDVTSAPPLDVQNKPEYGAERVVHTPLGRLYSVPLRVATNGAEAAAPLIGLLQLGPLLGQEVPRQVKRHVEKVSFPLALVVQQAHHYEILQQQLAAVTVRSEVGRRLLGSALELDRFVKLLLDLALNATKTDAGFVAIVNSKTQRLTIRTEANMPPDFAEQVDLSPQSGLFDWSLGQEGGALMIRDLDFAANMGMRSILAVPLLEGEEPLGVFALVNFERAETFAEHNLTLLDTFAQQIKLIIHNARLFESFTDQYLETVKGLARSLDARYPYTQDHHQRVTQVAVTLAQEMALPEEELQAIRTAGLIHDVGMAGIVEVEGGYQADFEHPTIGASLIEALPLHPTVVGAVATHHEWFDGWGFPRSLAGEAIPLGGRILAMAEFIVEMTTGNPFRDPWPQQKLVEELHQRHGTQFDPRVTDVALSLIEDQKLEL